MTNLLPPTELFLPFLVAGIALNLTPGADMTFVALSAARGGHRAGVAAAAGISAGCLVHILFAVVGLSALIAASQPAFAVVKWAGVAYLLYLAVTLLRGSSGGEPVANLRTANGAACAFRQAALVNVLNPKVGIFFLAFLPQFVEPGIAAPWRQILALGIVFNLSGILVNACVAVFSAAAARRLRANKSIGEELGRVSRWFAATVMGALAVKLAMSRNDP